MTKNWEKLTAGIFFIFLSKTTIYGTGTYPKASIKDVQATAQKKHPAVTSKHEIS
jgi:hypothetical protein